MIKLMKVNTYKYEDNKLKRLSANGWHDDKSRCTRNVSRYKVYAQHFNCALPYSRYYVVDTKTGEVRVSGEHLSSIINELVEQLRKMEE